MNGTEHEYRPNCVEITTCKERTIIVMLYLVGDLDNDVEPILVGRMHMKGNASIIDAVDLDGVCWAVQTPDLTITMRPYGDEAIFIDPSYGQDDLPEGLKKLYAYLRASRSSSLAHQRLLKSTPKNYVTIVKAHEESIAVIDEKIRQLENIISSKEARRDQQNA